MEGSTNAVVEIPRDSNPFSREGLTEQPGGAAQYLDLPESLITLLEGHVKATGDVEAVVELGGERLTYAQLWDRAQRVAGGLRDQGVEPGDRVAIRYAAGTNWVLAFWGTLMAKATIVAVDIRSAEPEVKFVLADSGTKVDLDPQTPLPDGEPYLADGIGQDDIAAIFYTSGTTGPLAADAVGWMDGAAERPGSWWVHWNNWITERAPKQVPALEDRRQRHLPAGGQRARRVRS